MTLRVAMTVELPDEGSSVHIRDACLARRDCTVDVSDRWDRARPGDIVALVWRTVADRTEADSWLQEAGDGRHAWLTEQHVQWDKLERGACAAPVPGVKQVSFLRRLPAVDHDAFVRHWADTHGALARVHHPTFWRYTQNVVLAPLLPGTPDLDGIAEITMRLRQDFVDRMYDSAEGQRVIADDVATFIDMSAGWRIKAREYVT